MAAPKISHLILNTANYEAMKQWYLDVFEAKIGVETSDHSACFLQTDESHHRIGMFNVAKTDESVAMTSPGAGDAGALSRLNHFAFEYPAATSSSCSMTTSTPTSRSPSSTRAGIAMSWARSPLIPPRCWMSSVAGRRSPNSPPGPRAS